MRIIKVLILSVLLQAHNLNAAPIGRIELISDGDGVFLVRDSERYYLRKGLEVYSGDRIETSQNALVRLRLNGKPPCQESHITIRELSDVTIMNNPGTNCYYDSSTHGRIAPTAPAAVR